MKVRYVALLALACLLSACANVQDVKKREPVFYGSSAKSAQEYTRCVAASWTGLGVEFVQNTLSNGYELVQNGGMGVEAVLTVIYWRNQTEASLVTRIASRDQRIVQAANLCL